MFFRADKRLFQVGGVIRSAEEFAHLNPAGSDDVEEVFETLRPRAKPPRIGSLFLFKDELVAKKHWSKMTGGILYGATVEPGCLMHEGDMRLFDEAFECRGDVAAVEELAKRYWAGEMTESPVSEVLVASATVSSVICDDQLARQAYFRSWALISSQSTETDYESPWL